jgi:NAD+ kinase
MKTVFLKINTSKENAKKVAVELIKWLEKKEAVVLFEKNTAKLLNKKITVDPSRANIDLNIALGGDGTLLSLARLIYPSAAPILGINIGLLGFLTEIKLDNMKSVLKNVLKDNYNYTKRMVLDAEVFKGKALVRKSYSLNDIVVSGVRGRLITLDVHLNDEYLNSYRADGLIISTPTGSTAYSLSAGGPIVCPTLNGIIITPVCPHTLTNRPIIVTDDSVLKIFVKVKKNNEVKLTADGQEEYQLKNDNIIVVKKAKQPVKLITPYNNSFYQVLREKLNWR